MSLLEGGEKKNVDDKIYPVCYLSTKKHSSRWKTTQGGQTYTTGLRKAGEKIHCKHLWHRDYLNYIRGFSDYWAVPGCKHYALLVSPFLKQFYFQNLQTILFSKLAKLLTTV